MSEKVEVREMASRFCSILAHLFSDELDRTTLWARIGSALETSLAKVSDDDLDKFTTLCLEHVKADTAKAAACVPLAQMLETFSVRTHEWRHDFLNYLNTHRFAVIVRARARWELVKKKEVEL